VTLAGAVVRAGRDADAAGIIRLIGDCWAEYPGCVMDLDGEVPELRALATYAADRDGALWVAEAAGGVVGTVCVWPLAGGDWELAKMYVAREWRGSGLAQTLAATAETYARAQGGRRIQLWTDTRFDRAHRFYEKRSYVRSGPLRVLGDKSHSIEFAYAKPLAGVAVQVLDAAAAASAEAPLARVLFACVAAGASVSFMLPLPGVKARAFWRDVARSVARGGTVLLAAWLDGDMVGTVQLAPAQAENQPHRAELQKLLVHPDARRRGIGQRLLAAAEAEAASRGWTLLTLDTGSTAAEALYRAAGWTEVGAIPGYALNPDGTPCATRFFCKQVRPAGASGATLP
jgi:GNAT superfamily N-acetyltransferase